MIRPRSHCSVFLSIIAAIQLVLAASQAWAGVTPDRSVLPVADAEPRPVTEIDIRKVTPPPASEVKPPKDAPNVVIVMLDDFGFGQASTFGGPIQMPTLDALAKQGLRYNRFHTTASCSPTRMALLTGRNSHAANMGSVAEISNALPGYTARRPNYIAPLAEILRLNGYATAMFGKSHETPPREISAAGPFDRWPTHSGFDKFYGFMAGVTDQYAPMLFDGTTRIIPPHDPNYHFMTDMTDQAVTWVRSVKALTPEKPFFVYFAPAATHSPHQVAEPWIKKYQGRFDIGWDELRKRTFTRQKQLGVIPRGTRLAEKPDGIKDWDRLTDHEKRLFARQMEVFAGYAEFADYEIGRLVAAIKDLGAMENTLFLYIVGDNGASAEGGLNGTTNEVAFHNRIIESVDEQIARIDQMGGPRSHGNYAVGWGVAGDTPFKWHKAVAANFGGIRNPLVISWPKKIKDRGGLRTQFHHVIDIAPTLLEAVGIPEPKTVNGVAQMRMHGTSMVYTFAHPGAEERHTTQYFETNSNRSIYHDGWYAGAVHWVAWRPPRTSRVTEDQWELYNTKVDFSLANDLADQFPDKLREMQELFHDEAVKYQVLPIDDRTSSERLNPEISGRQNSGLTTMTLYPGMEGIKEDAFINLKNHSFRIDAEVVLDDDANGVLVCQGGFAAGWSLYMKGGIPVLTYNWFDKQHYTIQSNKAIMAGKANIRFEFDYDGGAPGSGGTGTLFVNGVEVAEGRIDKTIPYFIGTHETADVGVDLQSPVTDDYPAFENRFSGTIEKVTIHAE